MIIYEEGTQLSTYNKLPWNSQIYDNFCHTNNSMPPNSTSAINCTFISYSRPNSLRTLYEKATTDRLSASILDQLRRDSQHSPYLLCTPVLGNKRRRLVQKVDTDIETHVVSALACSEGRHRRQYRLEIEQIKHNVPKIMA